MFSFYQVAVDDDADFSSSQFVEEQAIDRVHRLNQTRDVKIYKLIINESVEERIHDLQERKREMANVTLEGKNAATKDLTLGDMMILFGRIDDEAPPSTASSRDRVRRDEDPVFGRRW